MFSGLDREHRTYDFHTWQYEGLEVQAASGERDKEYQDRAATREAARGEAHGSGWAGLRSGTPERDETLQHPRCAFRGRSPSCCRYPASSGQQCSSARRGAASRRLPGYRGPRSLRLQAHHADARQPQRESTRCPPVRRFGG